MTHRLAAPVLAVALLCCGVFAAPPAASAGVGWNARFVVGVPAPPPLRAEVALHRPGRGHVWVRGFYDWDDFHRGYRWVPGAWLRPPRLHAYWVAPRYEMRHGRRCFTRGYWR